MHAKGHVLIISRFKILGGGLNEPPCLYMFGKIACQFKGYGLKSKIVAAKYFYVPSSYRHPKTDLTLFLNEFYATIDKISKENKHCVIMGDFNIDLLDYESHHLTEEYINTMNSLSFQPMITKPTRITDHSATLIDHFFFTRGLVLKKTVFLPGRVR